MNTAINVCGGKIDKETADIAKDAIVEVLKATFDHRSEAVTLAALGVIKGSLKSSADYMTISDVNINMSLEPELKEDTDLEDPQPKKEEE